LSGYLYMVIVTLLKYFKGIRFKYIYAVKYKLVGINMTELNELTNLFPCISFKFTDPHLFRQYRQMFRIVCHYM